MRSVVIALLVSLGALASETGQRVRRRRVRIRGSVGWWYYCESSTSYYPYVKECPTGWERVPPR